MNLKRAVTAAGARAPVLRATSLLRATGWTVLPITESAVRTSRSRTCHGRWTSPERAGDRLLAVTTTSFDISVLEIFRPLSVGGTVVLATRDEAGDDEALAGKLARDRIDRARRSRPAGR